MAKYLFHLSLLLIALSLSACGGGGGGSGGGGGASNGENDGGRNEPEPPRLTLVGSDGPVEKAHFQVIETSGITLREGSYTGEVNGVEVPLFRIDAHSLGLLLPPDLPAGAHQLTVYIDGKSWDVNFEAKASPIAPRADSMAGLETHFADLRTTLQDVIDTLATNGASQADIDELEAHKAALNVRDARYADLSEAELDYLNRFLQYVLDSAEREAEFGSQHLNSLGVAPMAALSGMPAHHAIRFGGMAVAAALDPPSCQQNLKRYAFRLTASTMLVGLAGAYVTTGSWFASTPVGFAVGALGGVVLVSKIPSVANAWQEAWDACVIPVFNALDEEATVSARVGTHSRRMTKTAIFNEEEKELFFELEIPVQYSLKTEFDIVDAFKNTFPEVASLVRKFSLIIPDALEQKILTRTAADYREPVAAAMIAIEQISESDIKGKINPVDHDSFRLSFSAPHNLGAQVLPFTFVLYDKQNEIKTRYQANLTIDSHCPAVYNDEAQIISQADRCIIIKNDLIHVWYSEYWNQVEQLWEEYETGSTSLKGAKGFAHSDIQDMYVAAEPVQSRRNNIVPLADGGYIGVLAESRELCSLPDDGVVCIKEFSDPLQSDSLDWVSVEQYTHSYRGGTLWQEKFYFPPYQTSDGTWHNAIRREIGYHPDVKSQLDYVLAGEGSVLTKAYYDHVWQTTEHFYSEPLQKSDGEWISLLQEEIEWHKNLSDQSVGTIRKIYTKPFPDGAGGWAAVWKERLSYYNTTEPPGDLYSRSIHSEPLQNDDGTWIYGPDVTTYYEQDGRERARYVTEALKVNGQWDLRLVRVDEYWRGCYRTFDLETGASLVDTCW